jgi:hypothetical protein
MKKQLAVYLVLGLLAGLLVTACAGVVTGVGPLTIHQPIMGPAVVGLEAPAIEVAPLGNPMLSRHLQGEKLAQPQAAAEWVFEYGGCPRGAHDVSGATAKTEQSNP